MMNEFINAILNKTKLSNHNAIAQLLASEVLATYALTH